MFEINKFLEYPTLSDLKWVNWSYPVLAEYLGLGIQACD